jgi:hypothetical protein
MIRRNIAGWHFVLGRTCVWRHCQVALWHCGYLAILAPCADAERAIQEARTIGQAATMMYALFWASLTYHCCRNYAAATPLIDELVVLANNKGALHWKALGMLATGP